MQIEMVVISMKMERDKQDKYTFELRAMKDGKPDICSGWGTVFTTIKPDFTLGDRVLMVVESLVEEPVSA